MAASKINAVSTNLLVVPPLLQPPLIPSHRFFLFPSSFFDEPARKAAMSKSAIGFPPAWPAAPGFMMLFIGLLFCLSSHSARISGSTVL